MVVVHSTRCRVIKVIHQGTSSFVSIKWQVITIYWDRLCTKFIYWFLMASIINNLAMVARFRNIFLRSFLVLVIGSCHFDCAPHISWSYASGWAETAQQSESWVSWQPPSYSSKWGEIHAWQHQTGYNTSRAFFPLPASRGAANGCYSNRYITFCLLQLT